MSDTPGAVPPVGEPSGGANVPPLSYQTAQGQVETDSSAQTFGMLCHLLSLCGLVLPIPLANILGPLVMWLVKKDQYRFVDDQGKESMNFQITVTIAAIVSIALMFLLIGFVLLPLVLLGALVMVIIASVNASKGIAYRYPICIRLIK